MTAPNCPKHGDLVLELARGQLDDREAMRADRALVGCDHCAAWWNRTFGDQTLAILDAAVDEAFSSWTPPARRRQVWVAAAAAVVLAIGLGTTTLMWRDGEVSATGAGSASTADDVVTVMDFENGIGDMVTAVDASEADDPGGTDGEAAVFVSGLESGDLSGWSSNS